MNCGMEGEIQTSLVHRSKCSNLGRGGVVGAGRWGLI